MFRSLACLGWAEPSPSSSTTTNSQKRYRAAIRKFEHVKQLHPGDYYANKMIADSQMRIEKGESSFWDW